jgi:hypothetical protein
MHASRRIWLILVGCAAISAACDQRPAPAAHDVQPAPTSPDSIPEAPVSGTIRGRDFALRTATYIVDRRPGYEHVDIRLSAGEALSPCEPAPDATSVWLRRKALREIQATQVHIAPGDQSPWEVHYQLKDAGHWVGNGDAAALIVINTVRSDLKLQGELWSCFADGQKSCVSGSFVATYCPIRIDAPIRGVEGMERPPAPSASAPSAPEASGAPREH